ncbi:MAG: hypothetical protein PHO18_03300 [Synergistaceae bacterium]|nr:hypothetical protein [Synergistaceae bacterium]
MMFTILFGALAVIVLVLMCFGIYIFAAYVFSRLGEKFRVGSFLQFLIPFYNIALLCDCARISRWFTVAIVAPGIVTAAMNIVSFYVFTEIFSSGAAMVAFASNVYLWGKIAERLGRNFWLWGIMTPVLLGLPILFLAFDGSMPYKDEGSSGENETRYIDV